MNKYNNFIKHAKEILFEYVAFMIYGTPLLAFLHTKFFINKVSFKYKI